MDNKEIEDRKILDKFNEVQIEILRIGWTGILKYYHPDTNISHPEAMKVFQLYKEIYADMQRRVIIEYKETK